MGVISKIVDPQCADSKTVEFTSYARRVPQNFSNNICTAVDTHALPVRDAAMFGTTVYMVHTI